MDFLKDSIINLRAIGPEAVLIILIMGVTNVISNDCGAADGTHAQ